MIEIDFKVNDVVMDNIIHKIIKENESSPDSDFFELLNECLGNEYSLDDLIDYITNKPSIKKRFEDILIYQNYFRGDAKAQKPENLQDII